MHENLRKPSVSPKKGTIMEKHIVPSSPWLLWKIVYPLYIRQRLNRHLWRCFTEDFRSGWISTWFLKSPSNRDSVISENENLKLASQEFLSCLFVLSRVNNSKVGTMYIKPFLKLWVYKKKVQLLYYPETYFHLTEKPFLDVPGIWLKPPMDSVRIQLLPSYILNSSQHDLQIPTVTTILVKILLWEGVPAYEVLIFLS